MTAHKAVKSLKPKLDSFCFLSHNFINLLGFFLYSGKTKKREDYLEWPEYFMAVAFLSAQRSKDPSSQVRLRLLMCQG